MNWLLLPAFSYGRMPPDGRVIQISAGNSND
jgi:hypothetical protein